MVSLQYPAPEVTVTGLGPINLHCLNISRKALFSRIMTPSSGETARISLQAIPAVTGFVTAQKAETFAAKEVPVLHP
ncbi:hypothetical protein CSA37_05405 [Candidatus Fermentibacteria bacterium]|nr:MAG: hypothetical protein CSA37_05405 [Candidatus Fermentibacteria bacterium]